MKTHQERGALRGPGILLLEKSSCSGAPWWGKEKASEKPGEISLPQMIHG